MKWETIVEYITHGNLKSDRRFEKTDQEWKAILTPEQYKITRQQGTETAHTGTLRNTFDYGKYHCINCQEPLFDSYSKFNSRSGWPSFTEPLKPNTIKFIKDKSHGILRVETVCNTCDAHLGHVFPDGPQPTGLRFCINSVAIDLHIAKEPSSKSTSNHCSIAQQLSQM